RAWRLALLPARERAAHREVPARTASSRGHAPGGPQRRLHRREVRPHRGAGGARARAGALAAAGRDQRAGRATCRRVCDRGRDEAGAGACERSRRRLGTDARRPGRAERDSLGRGRGFSTSCGPKAAAYRHFRARQRKRLAQMADWDRRTRRQNRRMSVAAAVDGVGWVNGLAAIRSLGRAGIRVLAVDHRPSALGFRSKYAERFLCPDLHADEKRFVAFVRALGEVVVFPTHDDSLNVLAEYLDDLPVLAPFPAWDVLEGLQSKRTQLEQAAALGIDTPRTRYPRTADDARAAAKEIGLPVLVKPEH